MNKVRCYTVYIIQSSLKIRVNTVWTIVYSVEKLCEFRRLKLSLCVVINVGNLYFLKLCYDIKGCFVFL